MSTAQLALFHTAPTTSGGLALWQQPELEAAEARIVLVGCTKLKRDRSAPAGDLYDVSTLYRGRRRVAEQSGHQWGILSALHGLVEPDRELEPYDRTIADLVRAGGGWAWAIGVIQAAHRLAGIGASRKPGAKFNTYDRPLTLEVHAGRPYVELLEAPLARGSFAGVTIEHPVAGMQIGEQLRHYKEAAA